ncbi:MAG: DUF3575 domain-containing protein [Flavobacterium sp.]|uniref:DUF3575 domain-containing protein n=1 Tax=Flavobacterium sp. TaxID=239 RepID=UPI0022BFD18F|nr:DUF3575 domain-containing protein [Flavobacterium sp.]MCZ8196686.1 DUF3575 domain-containing protein [Flavobacterium sp.]
MKSYLSTILTLFYLTSYSQNKVLKINALMIPLNGIEISAEFSNKKGNTGHEFVILTGKAPSFDSHQKYNQLGIEYRMRNYIFNQRKLNGFYIAAPVLNYIKFDRQVYNIDNKIEVVGIGGLGGYQFFLLENEKTNLTLDIAIGGNIILPINEINEFDNENSGLVLLPKFLRFNLGIGYAF